MRAGIAGAVSAVAISTLAAVAVRAETPPLPAPEEIFTIAVKPQAKQLPEHFTPGRLLELLPFFKPAYMMEPIGGKIWSQSGVIVLKSREVLFWRSYREDVLVVEMEGRRRVYALDP